MERFEATVPPTYFRNARAVIFVYAVNNQESIDNIIHWTESVSYQRLGDMSQTLIRALVANKIDLEDERIVEKERGLNTAERCEIDKEMYFEVSAKSGKGVDEMFNSVARMIKRPASKGATTYLSESQENKRPCCSL